MSIEKMTMMNIVGDIDSVDDVLRDLLKTRKVDLVSAVTQIEKSHFLFDVSDKNVDMLVDLNDVRSFEKSEECQEMFQKGEELKAILNLDLEVEKIDENLKLVSKEELHEELESICSEVREPSTLLEALKKELEYLDDFHINSFKEMEGFPIKVEDLRNMDYFDFKMGILSKENLHKMKKNYDNILAVLLHTGSSSEGEVYFVFYPNKLESEISRILRSLNFKEILLPKKYSGTPNEIKDNIERQKERLHAEINQQHAILDGIKEKYKDRIRTIMEQIWITSKLDDIKEKVAFSSNYFYISGWVSLSDKTEVRNSLKDYDPMLIKYEDEESSEMPTKLKNNWFFRPFEWLVNLYGTPSYNEIDPTPFVGISYMLFFGIMFGDLGQGFVMVIAGYFLSKKMELFGGLISRIGLASMLFGVLYGAVFGLETVIPALWMKPFENINDILMVAIFSGVTALLVAYVYGIINAYKRRDLEEGVFGKEGVAGVILYITLLVTIGGSMLGISIIPVSVGIGISVIALLAIVFRLPLTHLIEGKRPLHGGDISGYYVESIFSLIETFLSMLSGTISFIRVGAFALTHVGLFLAFETIGHMMGSAVGNVIVLIIGNIFVLGLEGLIVFIQGMRLQYYELFSRYYRGDGRAFDPVKLSK
ncbi:V-type ATP synthase subunit I [Gudongella sp. DL1XJH-153]|uniref:V-type ATP synthase subunit I n=1 Tax=Gudongella sp. DL1XJH-153 TaxID=3409804 RepID=UPI003BB6EAAD